VVADLIVPSPADVTALGLIDEPDEDTLSLRLSSDLDGVFAEVVTTYERAVFTTSLRVSDRSADAEDLAAETFLRAYAALRRYPPERIADLQLRPWLITICLNQWRNQVRTASRRPAVAPLSGLAGFSPSTGLDSSPGSGAGPEPSGAAESPEDRAERHDVADHLKAALRQLPTKQRVAVVLRHIVGLSQVELAEVLACPEGTARSHVSRGLDRLRVLLAHDKEILP
jgi:RNA polymerase sigma factor (sigma-70 family)